MLTGKIRADIDRLWEKFWTGGITNPLTVIEQISYLVFARMLDMQETLAENKARFTKKPFKHIFPETEAGQALRWKNFRHFSGEQLHKHLKENVYPFFATLTNEQDHFGQVGNYMQEATLEIKNESVLVSALELIDQLPLTQSDVKGDIYEYLLSKLSTAGINGQFRTPRHIIDMIVAIIAPKPNETVCDPACGTAGFLARTVEYVNKQYTSTEAALPDEEGNVHYIGDLLSETERQFMRKEMFWGFDFDDTMLRVSSMNMLLHDMNGANIYYQDTLNKSIKEKFAAQEQDFFDVILANPPFKGSLDENNTNPDVLAVVKTKKTELLFVAHILRALKLGGRAGVIVPDGVLFGSSKAHQQLRKALVEQNQLEGVISLPSGVFKPYAGVSTAVLLFTKGGSTSKVWFYDVQADGYSLDDKRTPIEQNDLPLVEQTWQKYREMVLNNQETEIQAQFGDKTQPSFVVDVQDIVANGYDLSINRYKEVVHQEQEYESPAIIMQRIEDLETEIQSGLQALKMLLNEK
ncbi:type I restriction-modification system subunit M [Actinobacillus equuli subsp. equuli]|uniref:type I restriction-modification system subunit M n=1 Tax=Actinobacillus equuli TaxID=718 RepID=UPI00244366E7|nr:type I restriction-modification system subunit M [Actinobacillus equuli]WGE55721.1 type I restriction-modification system subunit M [Actinobacillus equuli subsp. equuli]